VIVGSIPVVKLAIPLGQDNCKSFIISSMFLTSLNLTIIPYGITLKETDVNKNLHWPCTYRLVLVVKAGQVKAAVCASMDHNCLV